MKRLFGLVLLGLLALAPPVEAATTGGLAATVRITETGSQDLGTPTMIHVLEYAKDLTSGTAANTADKVFSDERAVASGTPDDLDLIGSLNPAVGQGVLNLTKPVALIIWNESTTTGQYLTIGNEGTNPCFSGLFGGSTQTITVQPNGLPIWYSPIDAAACTAGTADKLRITSATGSVTYRIIIWARSS